MAKKKTELIDPILQYALDHKDYFNWPLQIKQEACNRMAIWLTNMSFQTPFTRQELINIYREEGEQEQEFEYCEFINDVETFFRTKNWQHLEKNPSELDQ